VVGIQSFRTNASNPPGTESSIQQTQPPTPLQSTPPSEPPTTASIAPPPGELTNFTVTDLTFVGDDDGWALGSADCLHGPGRCTAMWRTTDGRHWDDVPGAEFNVPDERGMCAAPCVSNIRFANDDVGYAFGPSAFFMTNNGGESWEQQPGGAIALETLDDNVIRVTADPPSGCPGPCIDGIETSGVGSSDWTRSSFQPDQSFVSNLQLARGNGGYAYVLATRNPAGGAEDETSTLYRSTDRGETWQDVGEPCPQTRQEIDSRSIAAGDGGRVSALCMNRLEPVHSGVATSTDAGGHFARQPGELAISANLLTGDPDTVLVAAGVEGMARSTDGGATWQKITDVTGEIGWVGFESQQVGRAVSGDGSTIWTTRDGGATWHPASIG
jgi:photosystem II stability/assembly factor-like uncharacterized protein